MIVEVDHYRLDQSSPVRVLPKELTIDSKPLILILALRKLYDLPQTASTKCSFCILSQLVACCAFGGISWSELVPCPLVAIWYTL